MPAPSETVRPFGPWTIVAIKSGTAMCRWVCSAHGGFYEDTKIRGKCSRAPTTVTKAQRKAAAMLGEERRDETVSAPAAHTNTTQEQGG